ncbi:hypothetical protein P9239_21785 [Caballeronia sp. LZ062]|uniref:hypothetical protein n=1 Tax=unclassified Caballeronia TaxID=2646786 RepID=UPI0028678B5E|nr:MULTISPECIES: hypothetical protein [unclassified Caballeronia]MDR5856313.1 hypothetical protein [Caballeronia sp. LZ050]MDR5872983.1 hypothetical protein [Caballeronia sp. LZ062]
MKTFDITVDAQGRVVVSHAEPIGEHCKSRARLLSSLVGMIAAPGAFEHFCTFPDSMKRDLLSLMHSVAEESLPLLTALEQHTAQSFFDKGVQAATEQRRPELAANAPHEPIDYTQR